MEKHGGKRQNAGRKRGALNKTTVSIMTLAQQHGEDAVTVLAEVMHDTGNPQRVQAAQALLERGYGRVKPLPHVDIQPFMDKLKSEESSARDTALDIEGLQVPLPKIVEMLAVRELGIATDNFQPIDSEKLDALYNEALIKSHNDQDGLAGRGERIEREINEAKQKATQ